MRFMETGTGGCYGDDRGRCLYTEGRWVVIGRKRVNEDCDIFKFGPLD